MSDGTVLTNTYDHSYYIKSKGWSSFKPELTKQRYNIDAKQLLVGDVVFQLNKNGKCKEIKIIKIEQLKQKLQPTYTIFTEGENHSYFANGILVNDDGVQQVQTENNLTIK